MDLSIIIVSWNIRDLLAQCLQSVADDLTKLQHLQVETWVVDNVSTDGTVEMVQNQFPWVRLIQNQENVGFARANNQAISQSQGRYLLLLNPDTEIKPGALATLTRFMDNHPEAGAAGARHLNPDGTLQTSCYPMPTLSRELWRLFHLDVFRPYGSYRMADWDLDQSRPVDVLLGACLLLRRTALTQVGPLDEDYFIYSEEVDLCYRLQQGGWACHWVPQAQVVHFGGQSTQQVAREMFLRLYQGKLLFFRKHYGWATVLAYKLVLFAAAFPRLLLSPVALFERSSRRQQHLTVAANYGRLIAALPNM
jgi:GT2 family glycosyltransferase